MALLIQAVEAEVQIMKLLEAQAVLE